MSGRGLCQTFGRDHVRREARSWAEIAEADSGAVNARAGNNAGSFHNSSPVVAEWDIALRSVGRRRRRAAV